MITNPYRLVLKCSKCFFPTDKKYLQALFWTEFITSYDFVLHIPLQYINTGSTIELQSFVSILFDIPPNEINFPYTAPRALLTDLAKYNHILKGN